MEITSQLGRERLWNHARLLMLTAGFDGKVAGANPAWTAILGWKPEEVIGTNFFDLLHPEDLERTVAEAAAMMADGKQVPKFENRYRTRSGEYKDIDWTAVTDGECIYAIGRDVSRDKVQSAALAAAEDALRHSQKMEAIGQLTGGVAHDFNNLLTVIRGSTELLRRPDLTPERRVRYVDAIAETADRAAKLTGQLLAFARKQALRPELFDVGVTVSGISAMVRTLVGSRIELELKLPRQRLCVVADNSQLDTAIVNMAVNARDAMQGEGRIEIAVGGVSGIPARRTHEAVAGDFVVITVTDNGSGISEADIERIFEPFFTTKDVGLGTGLGLSQVIGFAKQSGGDIHVESRPGHGATFSLYLPRVEPDTGVAALVQSEEGVDGAGACVLVVEDNAKVGEFAVSALQELGYDSILANNAEEALYELQKDCGRFHVVFTDVVMPGVSGVELAHRIRKDHPDVPVILTSGYSHVLAQNGTFGFELLHKPYSLEQLSRVLRKAIAWQAAERSGTERSVAAPVPAGQSV